MRKFFLIPLMTMLCSVMAWGTEIVVNDFASLKTELSASGTADVVKLGQDIAYATHGSDLLNIERSLTLDGQGHKIVGWGICNTNHDGAGNELNSYLPLAINYGEEASNLDVTIQNLTMSTLANTSKTAPHELCLMVFDKVAQLTIENCDFRSHAVSGAKNPTCVAFYGETADVLTLNVRNSFFSAGASGYAFSVLKPINADLRNSTLEGYSSVTFYTANTYMYPKYKSYVVFGQNNSGSRGTTFYAKACDFNAPNIHSGVSNAYATFAIQDDGIDLTLDNCGIDATQLGDQHQWGVMLSPWTPVARRSEDVNITFTGDNSHINGILQYVRWLEVQSDKANNPAMSDFASESWAYWSENGVSLANVKHEGREFTYTANINITVSGGTYAQNVGNMSFPLHVNTSNPEYSTKFYDADNSEAHPEWFVMKDVTIPSGYEVQEVKQGSVTLYRVVKSVAKDGSGDPLYNLNDNVESQGAGQNKTTSFELSDGSSMTLNQETTKAGYVQVKDDATEGATTVTIGKATQDQTLVINNGLDVQGDSKVEVKPGSTLQIGEGGITTAKPENIVIDANETGAASLLLDPAISVNQNPELTVKMTVPAEHAGYEMLGSEQYRHWFRFAVPVKDATTWTKNPNVATYLYGWNYNDQEWAQVSVAEMDPFYGYTLSPDQEIDGSTSVTYTFKGKLLGNEDCKLELNHHGYNFFGNSYTGYISVLKLVDQIIDDSKIDGTVWMWDGEKYEGVALSYLKQYGNIPGLVENWKKEVAPMQTFVLRLTGSEFSSTDINYADAIWGNPRYTSAVASAAPARNIELNDNAVIRMTVSANNHKQSVTFIENSDFSDEYNRGYDAIKYMNENKINMYVSVNGENYGTIATDNLEGKALSLSTIDAYTYTLTFDVVAGKEYALRDNATGAIIAIVEGASYEFAAQPNSTIEGRFEIVAAPKAPTAIENTDVKANVKGIYTIMGQYLGEDFDILPAGVYVVNGVKIVK